MKIGFIGAGKVGKALGLYFKNHSIDVEGYYSKTLKSSREAAKITDTDYFDSIEALLSYCDIVFITTPDHVLKEIDEQISELVPGRPDFLHKTYLHASGAYPSDCLSKIKSIGSAVGSMHPLQSFGNPFRSAKLLEESFFSIEGTQKALEDMKSILHKTGGNYNELSADKKPLYHAGACIISNYLVTLLDCGMHLMESAGMDRKSLFQAVFPLINGTLQNIHEKGTVDALTGPIVRKDYNTITTHLENIDKNVPEEARFYRALVLKTIAMIEEKRLEKEEASILRNLLKGRDGNEQ